MQEDREARSRGRRDALPHRSLAAIAWILRGGLEQKTKAAQAIFELLGRAVSSSAFSGAQAAWFLPDGGLEQVCTGSLCPAGLASVEASRLFDIASVTKPFVSSAALRLVERGVLDLDETLAVLEPRLVARALGSATLAQLLAHEAGFKAWLPFFEQIPSAISGTARGLDEIVRLAIDAEPDEAAGVRASYSDLGFIVLGSILERRAGRALDAVVRDEVLVPLGLENVCYLPRRSGSVIASTERLESLGNWQTGEVHDENARAMGGIAGHAGLFATAAELARFGAAWIEALEKGIWLSAELCSLAIAKRPLGRGLGWDLKSEHGSSAGSLLAMRTFGHLGFTGSSLWVDPQRKLAVALLTNRLCYGRENTALKQLRPLFHDTLVEALGL